VHPAADQEDGAGREGVEGVDEGSRFGEGDVEGRQESQRDCRAKTRRRGKHGLSRAGGHHALSRFTNPTGLSPYEILHASTLYSMGGLSACFGVLRLRGPGQMLMASVAMDLANHLYGPIRGMPSQSGSFLPDWSDFLPVQLIQPCDPPFPSM